MNKKIFKASFMTAMLALISALVLIMGILFSFFEHQIENELKSEADFISHAVENEGIDFFDGFDGSGKRITLVGSDGAVIFDTEAETQNLDNHADREEIREAMKSGRGMSIRYSKTLTEKTIYYAVKLNNGSVLRISTNHYTILTILLGFAQPLAVVLVLVLLLALFLSSRVSRSILKPINELDLENPNKDEVYDELQPLLRKIAAQKETINSDAKKRESLRREFTANVSHELKTPLTSISGFAELMKAGGTPDDVVKDFSSSIYDEAQRLISLVNDILRLSELDEEDGMFETEQVDIFELAEEICGRLKSESDKRGIKMSVSGTRESICGVRRILDEMLYNLCDNAIKYNRDGGRVDVNVIRIDNRINVSISDTGIGIPKEHQKRVFERFYRVDKSHSKNVGGTGLGLAIVKHGAIYHNAEVILESREGRGTCITISFKE